MTHSKMACRGVFAVVLVLALCAVQAAAGDLLQEGDGDGGADGFAGLYHGWIVYRQGGAELEIVVELAPGPDGALVGVVDMPYYDDLTNKPLENIRVDGREIAFEYRHYSEVRGPDARYAFEAELSPDGRRLSGVFLEQRGSVPFELRRIGDPGDPRPRYEEQPLDDLGDAGDELRAAFNARRDEARLVLLLSPT